MLLENLIPITLIVLILSAIAVTIIVSLQARKIASAYLDNIELKDADENKPTLIRVHDNDDNDYIINASEIVHITMDDKDNKIFFVLIHMKDSNIIKLSYFDEDERYEVYNNFANYHINYE